MTFLNYNPLNFRYKSFVMLRQGPSKGGGEGQMEDENFVEEVNENAIGEVKEDEHVKFDQPCPLNCDKVPTQWESFW